MLQTISSDISQIFIVSSMHVAKCKMLQLRWKLSLLPHQTLLRMCGNALRDVYRSVVLVKELPASCTVGIHNSFRQAAHRCFCMPGCSTWTIWCWWSHPHPTHRRCRQNIIQNYNHHHHMISSNATTRTTIVRVSTSSISQCCNSSRITMSSDGARRLTRTESRWHHLVNCSRP